MNVQSAVMELFVTHIETESRLLKLWAQVNRTQAVFVERLIMQITHHFNKGDASVKQSALEVGQLCCAKYIDSDGKSAYYRARIINLDKLSEDKVAVQFVDYGNSEVMDISDIKSLNSMQTPLTNLRDQATEFYLAGVVSQFPTWDEASLEIIRQHLRYEEVQGVLMAEAGEKKLLRIYFQHTDYSEFLNSKGIGVPIQLGSQQRLLLESASLQISSPLHVCNFSIPPPRLIAPQKPVPMVHSNIQPPMPDVGFHKPHRILKPGEKMFTTPILDVNTEHMVYVSFVENGPWSFAVQLQTVEDTLAQLMAEINEYPPTPLRHPLMPGSVCLGRFSEDKTLCRAVVMSEMTDTCMLYYVDFGNSETRPYSEIYELPPKYMDPQVMALRFTLSGLKDIHESDEMKACFKDIVTEKLLKLKVVTPDGPPMKQYCELTDNGEDVLKILLEKTKPLEYKVLDLTIGAVGKVLVSCVINLSHFYIQLSHQQPGLDAVMMALEAHCTNSAQPLSEQSLRVGLACCALYAEDGKWYRAQILSVLPGAVNVKYVDYGNSDTVSLSSLRTIECSLVSMLHMQGVKCCLNGFEESKCDLLAAKFEELVGEETLHFSIVGRFEDCYIVNLFSTSSGGMVNIGDLLLETKAAMELPVAQAVEHESRYEAPVSGIAEPVDEISVTSVQENSQEVASTYTEFHQHNRGISYSRNNNGDNEDSWRSREQSRSWRSRDDGNGNWRDDYDKGRRGKERYSERNRGDHNDTEREHKYKESIGEQRENKRKSWARDEDRGGYRGGSCRNTDNEGYHYRRNEGRRRNTEDVFQGRRDDTRRKRIHNEDSRRGKKPDDFDTNNTARERKAWNQRQEKSQKFEESAFVKQDEEKWEDDLCRTATTTTSIKPLSINIGDTKRVVVVFCTNPQDFYVQVSDSAELSRLMDMIATTYESAEPVCPASLKSGSVCIARYAEDKLWYRAIVEQVTPNSALVFFCDYGNKQKVPLQDIKSIKTQHLILHSQGIPCSLLAAKPQNLSWSASEIDCFSGATEDKILEARFVSWNNGRYDVILKDTGSDTYVNALFGGTYEMMEAKGGIRKSGYDYCTLPKIIEPSQRFSSNSLSSDAVEHVSITWFIDPEQFYCQLKVYQTEMSKMMASIQEAYCSKSPTFHPIQVGLPVIAKFKADNVLYRAEVKDINDSVTVQFIDYGNCENVTNSCVWDMESRFMNIPKQAVLCTLQGVKPANEKWSQSETMKYFQAEEFQCTFHRFIGEKWEVTLLHNGINVASDLIEAGLAREELLYAPNETLLDAEPFELSLLPGQTLKVHVTFVEGVLKFFVHLNAVLAQKIQTMVDQHAENSENLQCVDAEGLSVGDICLASPDSIQWYRAKIVDAAQTTGVFVTFIDLGDGDEITPNKVMACPLSLKNKPAQATECALHGLYNALTPEAEDKFKNEIEDKDVIIKVEAVESEVLLVSLYDMEGRELKMLRDTAAKPLAECVCPLPVLSRNIRVWVSHVNNANSLWLHRVSDSEVLSELLDKLHNIYEEESRGVKITADIGSLCAAKSDSFGTWYRAKIVSINPTEDTCEVLYIDYGNKERVPIATNIKSLDISLLTPHELAVHISLPLTTSQNLTSQLKEITNDKEYIAVFSERKDNIWFADLFEGNMSLSGKLVELGHATLLPGMEVTNQIMEPKTQLASEIPASLEVLVSHFDSPGQFWLQLASNQDAIIQYQENIQIIAESLPATDAARVGLQCIAQFSEDNLWYRAVVLDINTAYITVRYTDYGNTSQLEVAAEEMMVLPEELRSVPDFAFPCCINASPIDGSYWNAEAVARCEELINQEATITINIVGEEEAKIVDVFVDGLSVVDVLLKENLAVPRKSPVVKHPLSNISEAGSSNNAEHVDFQQPEDTVKLPNSADIMADVGDSELVYEQGLELATEKGVHSELGEQCKSNLEENLAVVSHAESLKQFWLQYQSVADQVHELEYRLLEAEYFPHLDDIIEDELCAAIFDDDNHWYRAKILGKTDQGTQVKFIDYGNISVCEDLRRLPADLVSLPPMAQHCSLVLPETVTEWPPSAKDKFLDLVSDGCKLFEVKVIEQGDPVIVSLTYNGKQIQREICQDVLEASARLANLSKVEQLEEQENSTIYYMIEKDEYQENIRIPESSENKVEVPEDRETVFTDVQMIEELDDNDKCESNALDRDDGADTTVMYLISDGRELESQKEVTCDDEHVSNLNKTCSAVDKDGNEEPETDTSRLLVMKEIGDLPAAEENLIDGKIGTSANKDGNEEPETDTSRLLVMKEIGDLPAAEENLIDGKIGTSANKDGNEEPETDTSRLLVMKEIGDLPAAEENLIDGKIGTSANKDGNEEPETDTSRLLVMKEIGDLPAAEENLIDGKIGTSANKDGNEEPETDTSRLLVMKEIGDLPAAEENLIDGKIGTSANKDGNEEPETDTSRLLVMKEIGDLPAAEENLIDGEIGTSANKDGNEEPETDTSRLLVMKEIGDIPAAEENLIDGKIGTSANKDGNEPDRICGLNGVEESGHLITEENLNFRKIEISDDKDGKEPESNICNLSVVQGNWDLSVAEENLMDENYTESEAHSILVAEGKQCIGANDNIAPMEDSQMSAISADDNPVDEKQKSTQGSPEIKSDSKNEVNVLSITDNSKKHSLAEKAENSEISSLPSSESKIEHCEELVRRINVEMIIDKTTKKSQIDRKTSVNTSKEPTSSSSLPQSDEISSSPEKLLWTQCDTGATKSEPSSPLLSLGGNERIAPECVSAGESYDSVHETIT